VDDKSLENTPPENRSQLERTFFSIPESHWRDVGEDGYRTLSRIQLAIGLALAEIEGQRKARGEAPIVGEAAATTPLPPAELALLMHEVAGQILAEVASDEQDLRQIITTLRTAFTVSWDLYSFTESERVTVAEHMRNLKMRIEDFERELETIRRLKSNRNGGGQKAAGDSA
jgi:hypothetical protein